MKPERAHSQQARRKADRHAWEAQSELFVELVIPSAPCKQNIERWKRANLAACHNNHKRPWMGVVPKRHRTQQMLH